MTEIQYTYTDISNIISKNNNEFKLNENIEKSIKELFTILGCVENNNKKNNDRNFDRNYKNKGRRNRNMSRSSSSNDIDEWEMMRNFKPTQKVELSDFDNKLKEIRLDLNKISKLTYEGQKKIIIDNIFEKFQEEQNDEEFSENQKTIGNLIFDIVSTNRFLSEIYADLYVELVGKSEYFGIILDNFIENYRSSLNNIKYIDVDDDYDGFCDYNQKNETRKSNAIFLINLMKYNMITRVSILDLIVDLQNVSFKYIDEENKTHEVEEITENLFILITNSKSELENENVWKNSISKNIENFAKLKAKEHPSLSSRCIFKYMDM